MFEGEGFEVSVATYLGNRSLRKAVQRKSKPRLVIVGDSKPKEADNALFRSIILHCCTSTKKLLLAFMEHTLPANMFKVFPILEKLTIYGGVLSSDAILRFNEWCPNLTELRFDQAIIMKEDAYKLFTSVDVTYPKIKTFAFNFGNHEMTRELLAIIDTKFPKIECLNLTMEVALQPYPYAQQYDLPYEPLYFRNLKKLLVFSFGRDVGRLFDYIAASNTELKEFTFMGMELPEGTINWIASCNGLTKLSLDCPHYDCLEIDDWPLMYLKDMASLKEVIIRAKCLGWKPEKMIEFARNNPRVKSMNLVSDCKNDYIKFNDSFKKAFDELVQEGRQLKIEVTFFEGNRKVKISRTGFSETQEYRTPDTDEEEEEEEWEEDDEDDDDDDDEDALIIEVACPIS